MPSEPTSPAVRAAPSRASQAALAALAAVAALTLAVRGYGLGRSPKPTEHQPAAATLVVDLNSADRSELIQVPGLGPGLADAILTRRRDHGPFAAVEDLHDVKGIGGKTVERIRPYVTVAAADRPVETLERRPTPAPMSTSPSTLGKVRLGDPPIDVNAADATELQRLPGIGPTLATRIVSYRSVEAFRSPDDLRRVKGIGPKTLEAIRPHVVCR
jgi:competence protein ComEA